MSFDRAKATLGIGGRRRRYVDVEDIKDLEEVSDTSSTEDETQTSWREWAGENSLLAVAISMSAFIFLGVLLVWFSKYIPAIIGNIWVRRGIAVLLVAGVSYRYGWGNRRDLVDHQDELILKRADGQTTLKGRYLNQPGEYDAFIPFKGWRKRGHDPVPYTVADISAALLQKHQRGHNSRDDPAIIRLHPTETTVEDTDWGTRVTQNTAGLQPDEYGHETTLMATLPDYDDERLAEHSRKNEELAEENAYLRDRLEVVIEQRDKALDDAAKPVEDRVDEIIDIQTDLMDAARGRTPRSDDDDSQMVPSDFTGTGRAPRTQSNGQQSELDAVDEEVSQDDD